nr:MAG TPA: hypothetical protein [Caudoviricetes sp.]
MILINHKGILFNFSFIKIRLDIYIIYCNILSQNSTKVYRKLKLKSIVKNILY